MTDWMSFLPIILVSGIAICLITFIRTDFGIIVLLFSMLLSPELKIAQVPERSVVVRIDDIMLFAVFFTWLAKMAINKELGLLKKSPLNLPIIIFIAINILSTALGILGGKIKAISSFFYILKYIEYLMLYFLISNNLYNKKQVRKFIAVLLIVCLFICIYGTLQIMGFRAYTTAHERLILARVSAPFEGEEGEPNTLGGYLLLLFAVSLGIFIYSNAGIWKFSTAFLCLFIIPTFLYTLSRGSYLGFVPMYLSFIILTKKRKTLLIVILLLFIIIAPYTLPPSVIQRVKWTFVPVSEIDIQSGTRIAYEIMGIHMSFDVSTAERIETWKHVLNKLKDNPLFGYGVTGVGVVDSQLPLVLGETGIIGFWIFIWLMLTIFTNILWSFKNSKDDWEQGLILGLLAGFIGLLFHAFSAQTFIIVRIMEPFWFLIAIIITLPQLPEQA